MPGTRTVRDCGSRARNEASGRLSCRQRASSRSRPALPGRHQRHQRHAEHQRHPAALGHLQRVGGEEDAVDDEEAAEHADRGPARPAELAAEHHRRQHAGAEERAGDRDAVGGGQVVAAAEGEHQDQHADQRAPCSPAARRSGLPRSGWCGAPSCAAGSRAACTGARSNRRRRSAPGWRSRWRRWPGPPAAAAASPAPAGRTGSRSRAGSAMHQRALAEIVQHAGRAARRTARRGGSAARRNGPCRHTAPPPRSRPAPRRRAPRRRASRAAMQKITRMVRREREQDARDAARSATRAEHADGGEPHHHDRPEHAADRCRCRAIARRTAR